MYKKVLIINCFDTYENRVRLLQAFFQNNGSDVTILSSNYHHVAKKERTVFPEGHESIRVLKYRKNLSITRMLSHALFSREAMKRVNELQPDLLWVLVPPNSLINYAASYKKNNTKVKLVFDIIDMWPETLPVQKIKGMLPVKKWKQLRDRRINEADLVVSECNLYRQILREVVDENKLHTLYLASGSERKKSFTLNLPHNRISLCYLGSINNIIDIPCIKSIINKVGSSVDLHIIGDGEKRNLFIQEAENAGAVVFYHGKIYDENEKQAVFDQCHFGLNIMKDDVFVGLTMKSIDYFKHGLPIINNIKGDTWQFVENKSIGINYDEMTDLTDPLVINTALNRESVLSFFSDHFTNEAFFKNMEEIISCLELQQW